MHKIIRCSSKQCRKKLIIPHQAFKQESFKVKCKHCGQYSGKGGLPKKVNTIRLICLNTDVGITLHEGEFIFGRSNRKDITGLPQADGSVSRMHFQLVLSKGNKAIFAKIRDLDSTNGTYVNSKKIGNVYRELYIEDQINCGTKSYQLKEE